MYGVRCKIFDFKFWIEGQERGCIADVTDYKEGFHGLAAHHSRFPIFSCAFSIAKGANISRRTLSIYHFFLPVYSSLVQAAYSQQPKAIS
jgi:hypothetical protein